MSDERRPGPHPAPPPEVVSPRPLTTQLVRAIAFDMWPGNAAVMDFGLNSQEHYEALYYPVRNGEITAGQLDRALGNGPKLTELVNAAPSNPHKGIVFWTAWDELRPEPSPAPAPHPGPSDSANHLPDQGRGEAGAMTGEPLSAEARQAVIRETFEAITAVGFTKWKAEELMGYGYEVSEEDRRHYIAEYERKHFADFQQMAAATPDDRLLDAREYWVDKANAMGLREWQEVLSRGEGGEPFYEQVGREIAARQAGGQLAAEERRSVLGYPLEEPTPAPARDRDGGRGRTS